MIQEKSESKDEECRTGIAGIPEDVKYHIVHHLKQKPLRVLSLNLCIMYQQLPSSGPANVVLPEHTHFTYTTYITMIYYITKWKSK